MQIKNTEVSVFVNNIELLRSEYSFNNIKDTSKGYTRYFGRITLVEPAIINTGVVINIKKTLRYFKRKIELILHMIRKQDSTLKIWVSLWMVLITAALKLKVSNSLDLTDMRLFLGQQELLIHMMKHTKTKQLY